MMKLYPMHRMSGFVFLWTLIWICVDSKPQNMECLENPQSSNCMALGGSSSKSVDVLEIFQANMETLSTSYFLQMGYQNVSQIKLRSSHVKNIEEDAFAGLNLLRRLDLCNNSLETLTSAGFRGLELLEMLVLTLNKINKIEEGTFKNLASLIYLNIRNNHLSVIPDEIQELSNLTYLDMSHNDFSNTDVIIKSTSLNFLILSSNKIVTLTKDSFKGCPQLRLLDISKNCLVTLPYLLLSPLSVLVVLDVSDNRLYNEFPNIYKPENLTRIITYVNETKTKNYCSELLNNEFSKNVDTNYGWVIKNRWVLICIILNYIIIMCCILIPICYYIKRKVSNSTYVNITAENRTFNYQNI